MNKHSDSAMNKKRMLK